MTWITDGSGTRWVDIPQRPRRKPARALRFAALKIGDQIYRPPQKDWYRKIPIYYVVTDLWFDPVEGQDDPIAGQMVGFAHICEDGTVGGRKTSTTIRGLASQQYHYADVDYISIARTRLEAAQNGSIVGIGHGRTIRARPKVPGRNL